MVIWVGKTPAFLNLLMVNCVADIGKFPEQVRQAIQVVNDHEIKIDCLEYGQEKVKLPAYIAWEEEPRCPHGWNLWVKANAAEQLKTGLLEEVDGKFRQTKTKVFKAELYTGEFPTIFEGLSLFDGQVTIDEDKVLKIVTPWGEASCKPFEGYVILYGPDDGNGHPDVNCLTVGTASFKAYNKCTPEGKVIRTLEEHHRLTR
jgi:hypothetical protein